MWIAIVSILIAMLILWLTAGTLILNYFKAHKLAKVGALASAKIVNVRQTYQFVNNDPIVAFTLEVYPPDGQTYEAETQCLVPLIALSSLPKPGERIPVLYDPADPKSVLIDLNTIARTRGTGNTPYWQGVTEDWV